MLVVSFQEFLAGQKVVDHGPWRRALVMADSAISKTLHGSIEEPEFEGAFKTCTIRPVRRYRFTALFSHGGKRNSGGNPLPEVAGWKWHALLQMPDPGRASSVVVALSGMSLYQSGRKRCKAE